MSKKDRSKRCLILKSVICLLLLKSHTAKTICNLVNSSENLNEMT